MLVLGMYVSLECRHYVWKNRPVARKGSFQGKEEGRQTWIPTLVDVCDYILATPHIVRFFNNWNVRLSNLIARRLLSSLSSTIQASPLFNLPWQ
jgi:hypothetical protein